MIKEGFTLTINSRVVIKVGTAQKAKNHGNPLNIGKIIMSMNSIILNKATVKN